MKWYDCPFKWKKKIESLIKKKKTKKKTKEQPFLIYPKEILSKHLQAYSCIELF